MQEVLRALQPLGCTYGNRRPQTTTFTDAGRVAYTSPLRAAYAHIEPTILGYLAASLRLLRMPQVVYGLGQVLGERSLVTHLLGVYGINLATIYGDNRTADRAYNVVQQVHMLRFPAEGQPDWLVTALGKRRRFSAGDYKLRAATTAVLASGAALAHQRTGVLSDGHDGDQYCRDLDQTVGFSTNVQLNLSSPFGLHLLADSCPDVPLMNRELVVAAGVPALVEAVLATELAPGVPIAAFATQIMGLMWQDDRQVLGLEQSSLDVAAFDNWADTYARMNAAHSVRPAERVPDESDGELSKLHFFTVASRRVD